MGDTLSGDELAQLGDVSMAARVIDGAGAVQAQSEPATFTVAAPDPHR